MNSGSVFRVASLLAVLLCACLPAALADTIVLDGDDVADWARVFSSYTWKQKDSCLHPNSLMKFDLAQIPTTAIILDARLYLFVERTQPGASIDLWHVTDDSWSYAEREPAEMWDWPVNDLIGTQSFQDTLSFSVDVTSHLIEEAQSGGRVFSIKMTAHDAWYESIRISSPLAPLERMRPRIVVTFSAAATSLPDLAVTQSDIRMIPMRPVPGQAVTLRARVRNIGAQAASSIPVSFWDGEPNAGNPPIGTSIIPSISGGGGAGLASVSWTCTTGARDIYVAADPDGAILEGDEKNNADVRPFVILDTQQYQFSVESFEHSGRFTYHGDFDVPKQFQYPGPKSFYVNASGGEAYAGHRAMEMYLDGTADDGTIWVQTAIPVQPLSSVAVNVSFEVFRYFADMAFQPVAAVTLFDPEMEGDFSILGQPAAEGWTLQTFGRTVWTGPYDMLYVAVGLTCTWETPGTFYIDQIVTQALEVTTEIPEDGRGGADGTLLYQSLPNPSGPLTTIAYRLDRSGPVSLRLFDAAGRFLTTLQNGLQEPGLHRVRWDGTDETGRPLPSGVYFYRLDTAGGMESRKLLLAR